MGKDKLDHTRPGTIYNYVTKTHGDKSNGGYLFLAGVEAENLLDL